MKQLLNKLVERVKRVIFMQKGLSWCNKVISQQNEKVKVPQNVLIAYKARWKKLSRFVSKKYLLCFASKVEISSIAEIAPEDIVHHYIEPVLNPYPYRAYLEDKNNFARILPSDFLPQEYLRCVDGKFYDADYQFLNSGDLEKELQKISATCQKIIVKPSIDSSSGRGICFYKWDGEKFIDSKGVDFLQRIINGEMHNFVAQEVFEQSDFMRQFCSTSINTLRIVTYKSVLDDTVHIPAIIMRIGKTGSLVDNAHSGGSFVSISPESGELGKYVSDQFGKCSSQFNGIDFEQNSFVVPHFTKVLEFAKSVASKIPYARLLALDVVLGKDNNPKILEYNIGYFSCWLFPFVGQTPFGKWTDEIIDYCADKKDQKRIWLV